MLDFQKLSASYQQALLRQIVPFWLKHGRDELCGGYFDFLSTTGNVIPGNKFITLQAQQTWAFAWLYNTLDGQPAWLDHAQHGGAFLSQFAHSDTLATYGELDRRGSAVAPATGILSDCFTMMAYAQLHRATGNDEWAMLAKQTLTQLLKRRDAIRKSEEVATSQFQSVRHLSEPVALLKAIQEMQLLLDEETWKETIKAILQEIVGEFLDRRSDILREYILPGGAFLNTPEGRRLNVGLTFQTAAYVLDSCLESGNRKLALQATTWCLRMCEYAWNEVNGGFYQYIDFKKQPVVFPEWTQKWAWVHLEAITALTKSYFQTRHPDCPRWINRIHEYTFQAFPDQRHPGWHLAIGQTNQPLIEAKAIATVGCFSLIKCLAETSQLLIKCGQLQPLGRNIRVS